MEPIFLAGLSIPALTLVFLMVSFYQSFKTINFGLKRSRRTMMHEAIEKKELVDLKENSDFKHMDFSGGLLGI